MYFQNGLLKTQKRQPDAQDDSTDIMRGMTVTRIQMKLSKIRGMGWGWVGMVADKHDDKDLENDVDEQKYLMKDNSVC